MDIKDILLLLADTDGNGKVDLADLPGVLKRVTTASASVNAIKAALKGLVDARKLANNGVDVTPERLAEMWNEARVPLVDLGANASESKAAIG